MKLASVAAVLPPIWYCVPLSSGVPLTASRKVVVPSGSVKVIFCPGSGWLRKVIFRADVAGNALRVMDKGRRLSAAHMALVTRLRSEEAPAPVVRVQRPEKVAEVNVAAPEGRTTVRGVVVSAKGDEKCFGGHRTIVYRMTVKVATEAGVYLVNGTLPQALFDACEEHLENVDGWVSVLRGCEVEFSAELTRSDKEHFAFASRPTRARLVSWPAEKAKRAEDVAA